MHNLPTVPASERGRDPLVQRVSVKVTRLPTVPASERGRDPELHIRFLQGSCRKPAPA